MALQDAEKQTIKVINSAFGVNNLSASTFLNDSGKLIKLILESLQGRSSGITFSRFYCRINPTLENTWIQKDPFFLQFSQQRFDTITNKVEDISSPAKTKIPPSTIKSGGVSMILVGGS